LVLFPDLLELTAWRPVPDRVLSGCRGCALSAASARAQQELPYFVTYSSVMEEPGNLEIENQNIAASPKNANAFFAPTVEFY
jgi:hypothetical protein